MQKFSEDINVMGIDFHVEGTFISSRPAPNEMDHDKAGFSDPGDNFEIDEMSVYIGDQEVLEILNDEVLDGIVDELEDILDGEE